MKSSTNNIVKGLKIKYLNKFYIVGDLAANEGCYASQGNKFFTPFNRIIMFCYMQVCYWQI